VQALAGLRAPYGVFACLGTMSSILETRIPSHDSFLQRGFASCAKSGHQFIAWKVLNLIGVDYQQARSSRDHEGTCRPLSRGKRKTGNAERGNILPEPQSQHL